MDSCADATAVEYLERIAVALETGLFGGSQLSARRRPTGAMMVPGLSKEDKKALAELKADVRQIKIEMAEIKELLTAERGEVVKEAYSVGEVAQRTKHKPFTIRQACNMGRIAGAYKGKDHAWRIPYATLRDILTNGLSPP